MKKLTLSRNFELQRTLCFLAFIFSILLFFAFALMIAIEVHAIDKYYDQEAHLTLGFLVFGFLASLGLGFFGVKRRAFLQDFGSWQEADDDENPERRKLLSSARMAFMSGDFAKAIQKLDLYLKERPDDATARLNMASSLALDGQSDAARIDLELAGDPRKLLKRLPSDEKLERSQKIWSLLALMGGVLIYPPALELIWGDHFYKNVLIFTIDLGPEDFRDTLSQIFEDRYDVTSLRAQDFLRAEDTNFVFLYHDPKFLNDAQQIADQSLAYDLDFFKLPQNQFENHKITVFLTDSKEEYLKRSPFAQPWEGGCALPDRNVFYLYKEYMGDGTLNPYFTITMAHELCHICYYQIIKNIGIDSWLNEGLAQFNGYSYLCGVRQIPTAAYLKEEVFDGVTQNQLPFQLFLNSRPQQLDSTGEVLQFYNQGFSLVYVLLQFYGKDAFVNFLHAYSETHDMNAALASAYPTIHSMDDLHGIWTLFMK